MRRVIIIFLIAGGLSFSADFPATSDLTFRVYDAWGKRLKGSVGTVRLDKADGSIPLEAARTFNLQNMRKGKLHVSGVLPGTYTLSLLFEGRQPAPFQTSLRVGSGKQESVIVLRTGGAWFGEGPPSWPYSGRAKGCPFDGDWWVVATPMFQSDRHKGLENPSVSSIKTDGRFEVDVFHGQRYVIIFGHRRDVVKSFSTTNPISTKLGTFDLNGSCPVYE